MTLVPRQRITTATTITTRFGRRCRAATPPSTSLFVAQRSSHTTNRYDTNHWTKPWKNAPNCRMFSKVSEESKASSSTPNRGTQPIMIPRTAVSVAVRVQCHYSYNDRVPDDRTNSRDNCDVVVNDTDDHSGTTRTFYLLIQRGTEPNRGMWSLPGGKIDYHESTFDAAQRELFEETIWYHTHPPNSAAHPNTSSNGTDTDPISSRLQWYHETILTTDAMGEGYHYVIAHYLANYPTIHVSMKDILVGNDQDSTPTTTTFAETVDSPKVRARYLPIVVAADDAVDAQWYTLPEIDAMERQRGTTTRGVSRVVQHMEWYHTVSLPPPSQDPFDMAPKQ